MDKTEFMTGYEKRVFNGWKKTAADLLKDGKMLEATLKRVLSHEIPTEDLALESGEVVNIPLIELLVLKKVGYDLDHPKEIDLKAYSSVLGETKQEIYTSVEAASDIFKGIYTGAKPDGSSTRQPKPSDSK